MTDPQPYALALYTDGSFQVIAWPATRTLQHLYSEIGCTTVMATDLSDSLTLWHDDLSIFSGAPVNTPATRLYAAHRPPHQTYHGTVVITGPTRQGTCLPLTTDQLAALLDLHLTAVDAHVPGQRDHRGA
ncbi:DUF3846 domain-containing protein [Streptomyces anulatus]|uniref:DUF3846 domain-containing protein n=1 Tax=Streptomyces anulatus TaxID=1892 RepID=UPI00342D6546